MSMMFQPPPQIVLGCSDSKWYLNLVFHPLNTSCKNQEPTRHEHNVTGFYTKLYWGHHGRSLPRTFSPLTFYITEPSQLHSSSAIGLSHYAPLMDIQIQYVSNLLSPHNYHPVRLIGSKTSVRFTRTSVRLTYIVINEWPEHLEIILRWIIWIVF